MLIMILLCFAAALICAALRTFYVPNPPGRPHLGWLGFAFFVLGIMIYFGKVHPGL